MKRLFRLSKSFFTSSFLQMIVAVLCLAFMVYFIRNEHLELRKIQDMLSNVKTSWLLLGILITIFYVVLQGVLYYFSFKTIGCTITISTAIRLFLKRNFISTFLPAGAFTSLAFFQKDLDRFKMSKIQVYYGSFIFAIASMISVVLVAIPAFVILLFKYELRSSEIFGLILVVSIITLLVFFAWSLKYQKGFLYRLLGKISPTFISQIAGLNDQPFSRADFVIACIVSLIIEFAGVVHLYISMVAFGVAPSWEASFIGYVVMVVLLSISPFLRGLGAIEVSVTYILTLFGKSILLASAITVLFRFFEFWIPFFAGAAAVVFRKGNLLLRVFPALLLMLLGAANVLSALTPAIPERLEALIDFIPVSVAEFSNIAVLLLGIIMLISSAFLLTGARNAWKTALIISSLSLIGNLTKAIDYEEALLAFTTILILLYTRKAYFVKHDIQFQLKTAAKVLVVISALSIYSLVGFYMINKNHLGFNTTLSDSFIYAIKSMFFISDDLHPLTSAGKYFIMSVQLGSAATIAYAVFVTLRPSRPEQNENPDRDEAKYLIKRYGHSSLDYFKAYPDKQLFFSDEKDAFLAYVESRHYSMVLENPVAKNEAAALSLIQNFEEYCADRGLRTFYYRITAPDVKFYTRLNKKAILLGQEAIVDLSTFSLEGGEKKSLRNAIRKIEQSGLRLHGYHEPLKMGLIQKLKSVSDDWLEQEGHEEAGFSQGVFAEEELKNSTVLTVEDKEEKIFAFATLIPSYKSGEATYDLIRHTKDAPNGTLDFLMVKLIEYFKDNNFETLNMGLVPLAGTEEKQSLNEQAIRIYRDYFRKAARFKGSYEYKNKFGPRWENRYLIYGELYDLVRFPRILDDVGKTLTE